MQRHRPDPAAPRDRTVAVEGGVLQIAEYGPASGTAVLAVHDITGSSRSWTALARLLPDLHLVAPDLRGRGRSNGLPGPFGLRQHAEDLRRVLDAVGAERLVVVGHSMGAFVAVLLAELEPQRVAELVLIDGGFPIAVPEGVEPSALLGLPPEALSGPAFERLTRVFPSRRAYAEFWRAHPAFVDDWTDDVAAWADYDLDPVPGGFRPSANSRAAAADQLELFGPDWYCDALRSLRLPITALRAPLGLAAESPGIYPRGALGVFTEDVPQLEVIEVPESNHYTILMTRPAVEVAAAVVFRAGRRVHALVEQDG